MLYRCHLLTLYLSILALSSVVAAGGVINLGHALPPLSLNHTQTKQTKPKEARDHLNEPTPLIITLGYQNYRVNHGDAAYLSGDGGTLALMYQQELKTHAQLRVRWGGVISYMASSDREQLTPSAEALLNPQSGNGSEANEVMSSIMTSTLMRPEDSERSLGLRQRVSIGASLSAGDTQRRWEVMALGGGVGIFGANRSQLTWFNGDSDRVKIILVIYTQSHFLILSVI